MPLLPQCRLPVPAGSVAVALNRFDHSEKCLSFLPPILSFKFWWSFFITNDNFFSNKFTFWFYHLGYRDILVLLKTWPLEFRHKHWKLHDKSLKVGHLLDRWLKCDSWSIIFPIFSFQNTFIETRMESFRPCKCQWRVNEFWVCWQIWS